MSTATEERQETEAAEITTPPKGSPIKARHIVLGIGIGFAAVTAISGLASAFIKHEHDDAIQREVFQNIPGVFKLVFYTLMPLMIIYGSVMFANRVKNWERGRPDNRATTARNAKRRMADFRAGVYMQTLLREPGAGIMHSLIYFNFVILLGVTTVLEINHQLPSAAKFLHGGVYQGYSFVGDLAGLGFLVGIVWAAVRRYGPRGVRPYRIRIKSKPEHAVILGVFGAIGVTGFGTEMFRIAASG